LMRLYGKRAGIVSFMVVLALSGGDGLAQDAPLGGLRVPLEIHENGQVKTQIKAEKAAVSPDGAIEATEVRIEMFTEEGELELLVEAESCSVDGGKERVTSDGRVRFEREGLEISGRGFEWQAGSQIFKILNEAKVVFVRDAIENISALR